MKKRKDVAEIVIPKDSELHGSELIIYAISIMLPTMHTEA